MPRCALHKYCRPDCREVLYRGSCVFFFFQSQGCFSFMRGRFREAVVLVWTIRVITASRMNESVCLLKHTHTQKFIFTVGGWLYSSVNTVKYTSVYVFVADRVTCMMRTLFFYTTALWFSYLFTDSVMLMYLCGSQGSFLPREPCCPPSYCRLMANYSPIMMLSW